VRVIIISLLSVALTAGGFFDRVGELVVAQLHAQSLKGHSVTLAAIVTVLLMNKRHRPCLINVLVALPCFEAKEKNRQAKANPTNPTTPTHERVWATIELQVTTLGD
jgi:hypothetical protein